MEIHAPEGPVSSLKQFAVHILIVTIGILIALGLEGVRESWRERNAAAEAQRTFVEELRLDREQLKQDTASVNDAAAKVGAIVTELPGLEQRPDELAARFEKVQPGFYFFRTSAWEAAVASGVLAHMPGRDVNRFVNAYLSVRNYQDAQKGTIPTWIALGAYLRSRHRYTPEEMANAEQQLLMLQRQLQVLEHLGGEMSGGLQEAIGGGAGAKR